MTNEELVAAIQAGDESKLPQLWGQVERFVRGKAYRYGIALNLDPTLQEDLYQSGYLAMYTAAKTYDSKAGTVFMTWFSLYLKTAFREAIGTRTTRQGNDPLHNALSLDTPLPGVDEDVALGEMIPAPSPWESVEDNIWQAQAHDVIEAVLSELPKVQEEILYLKYYNRRTQEDIAGTLGIETGAVRIEEQKAMRVLRYGRRSMVLRALLDGPLPTCYQRVGTAQFHRSGSSAVEALVFKREQVADMKCHKLQHCE